MISGVLQGNQSEMEVLEYAIRKEAAFKTDERVVIVTISSQKELKEFISKKKLADIICVDISVSNGINNAELLRRFYPKAVIIILADISISPIVYMKPSIMAAALILRPLNKENIYDAISSVFDRFIVINTDEEVFLIDTREEKRRIPLSDIMFFETRDKKIFACTEKEEFGFYETMDNLDKKMSESFVRCHRSYMVNRSKIKNIMISKNSLLLKNGINIPISRSYKPILKTLRS